MKQFTKYLLLVLAVISIPSMAFAQPGESILSTGAVAAKSTVVISAKIQSYVEKLAGDTGTVVKKGQTLIKLNDAEFQANVALAKAHLYEAQAVLSNAETNFKRMSQLIEKGSTTQSAFDDAKTGFNRAKANVAIAEAELRKAQVFIGYTNLTSPIDGTIDSKAVEIGELTSPGQPLMRVTDTKNLRFETTVKESDVNQVKPGDPVIVLIDALPNTQIKGVVAHIVPSGDKSSHSFIARIDLAPTEGLRIGMYGKVRWK